MNSDEEWVGRVDYKVIDELISKGRSDKTPSKGKYLEPYVVTRIQSYYLNTVINNLSEHDFYIT